MVVSKGAATKEDLKNFKEEIVQQFHIISEDVISQVKQVAEGVSNVNEKLDRFREETGVSRSARINPVCLNAGLMKPWKGFTSVG